MKIAPDAGERPYVEPRQYGADGEAEILSIAARECPGDKNKGTYYVDISVGVTHPERGLVPVHTQPFGKFNTQIGSKSGSKVAMFLTQLGYDPELTDFADEPDENGLHKLVGTDPGGTKVLVDVDSRTYTDKDSGDEQATNFIKNIFRKD